MDNPNAAGQSNPAAGGIGGPAPVPDTRLPRLVTAMATSTLGVYIALLTPLQLLLTLHLTQIVPEDGKMSATTAFSVVTGVGALLALFANPFGGRVSDRTSARFGRRRTWILTGALSGALVLTAMSWTTEVWQVVVVWCLVQTLTNFQQAATIALMPDQVPPGRRGSVSGILGLVASCGPLIGLTLVAMIRAPAVQWAIAAVACALGGVIAVLLVRERPLAERPDKMGLAELAHSFWVNPRRHPAFGWAWLIRFLLSCSFAANTYHAFYLMQRFGVAEDKVAGVVLQLSLLSTVVLAITAVIGGFLSDKLRRQKPFVAASGVFVAVSLSLMAFAPSLTFVFVAMAFIGVGTGLAYSVDTAMCVRVLPSSADAGKDLGVVNMANTIPQSVVPFVAAPLLALGGFSLFYVVLGVVGVLGAVAVVRIPEIGQEGDPRYALITRPAATVA
ncbi:MAG: MFS transporter [Bifidobacteriaceae bacterium]|jgi:MFS family permease|nr:MFS transporter [Bifidobacteriaceae bacterium]